MDTDSEHGKVTGRQKGYILLVAPILLLGISFLAIQAMNRSRVSIRIASSDFRNLQTMLCTQQCAALSVNSITRAMDGNARISSGGEACACPEQDNTQAITCGNSWGSPVETRTSNCYGLQVAKTNMDIKVQCREGVNRAIQIQENVSFQEIPIFQFAVFFDKVLELHNGPPMVISGRVHSNDTIRLFPVNQLSIEDWVTSAEVIEGKQMNSGSNTLVALPKMDGSGADAFVRYTNTSFVPLADLYADWPDWKKNHRVAYAQEGGSCGSVQKLAIPLKGVRNPHTLIDWRETGDSYDLKRQKYAWRASLIYKDGKWVDNQLNAVSIMEPKRRPTRRAVMTDAADANRVTFWDNRENAMVKVISIDVSLLQQRSKDSIVYLFDELPDPGQSGRDVGGFLLTNGDRLLRPLTVVSNSRIYMWGDYNTDSSYAPSMGGKSPFPSAIICDVYTQLSNQWNPTDYTFKSRWSKQVKGWKANEVTILNACVMAGIPENKGSWSGQGGYHNFIRFMEDWHDIPFRYSGSTVAIWSCAISQGGLDRTWFYPPIRKWAFDPMYNDLKNMPPGTPRVVSPGLNSWEIVRE